MRVVGRLVLLGLMLGAIGPAIAAKPSSESGQFRQWLTRWLSREVTKNSHDLQFGYALVDLNGDKRNEALAWISTPDLCGTGGCRLSIFAHDKKVWKLVSNTAATRPPIRVLSSKTKGWSDIGVIEAGGGIQKPYEGRLRFDGKRYDVGWTGSRVLKGSSGRVLIREADLHALPRNSLSAPRPSRPG